MDDERHDDEVNEEEEEGRSTSGLMGSRTSHLDDRLADQLEAAFNKETSQIVLHELAKIAADANPIDLGFAVSRLPHSARPVVYANLPGLEAKVEFMINADSNTRVAVFRHTEDDEILELLESSPPDEATWLVEDIPERRLRSIFPRLDPDVAERIRQLLKHGRETAGRLMTNEFFAFSMNTMIQEVRDAIRDNPGVDLTRRIFVLDDDGELQGFVPSRNLIISAPDIPLRQVMQPVLHKVSPDASREEVIDVVERYKIPALPVVEEDDVLVGVITYEDVVEVMEDIADETIAHMAGTSEDVSEHDPIFKRFLSRAPWITVTVGAGLVIATGMDHFTDRPWYIFIPPFVPLITGISGNIGIQCSTMLVRSMATGEITVGRRLDAMTEEIMLGMFSGSVFALVCGFFVWAFNSLGIHELGAEPHVVAFIVSAGILGACINSTLLGVISPFLFARIGVDPAVASGPIVASVNDTVSIFTYFFVSYGLSMLLM